MSRKSNCQACFVEKNGIKTRISVEHTCWSKGILPLIKIVAENENIHSRRSKFRSSSVSEK